ncbi:protein PYRICULARIA ORYZAE RESISTANCE 21-like [Macadamia integrifolia]|uniref:protein PYRICULARIA ORYZAE RESISTANCE 21-like n=1 Tax=Macadamia integrifolia TaxID=60698 RepID=UPI001C5303B3|nr:protein PYRICULARIA ORYZAE RESISTANCE 21-like [Macadamia integrifolia]
MADKVYTIVLHVDLGCPRCHKKIKKTLSKYRERYQIQEEKFDEKQNTVTLSGPFCPNKLAKKLCCKAGESIKCIKILDKKPPESPPPPPPKPKPKPTKPEADPPKPPPAPKPDPAPTPAPKPVKPTTPPKTPDPPPKKPDPVPQPVCQPVYPPVHPMGVCCRPCYEGYGGGPCQQGYGYYGYYGYGRPSYISPCCRYFSEEEPTSCAIM